MPSDKFIMPSHIVHVLLSNPSICRLAPDCWVRCDHAASLSIKFDCFTFCQRLPGPTALCWLIPAQGADSSSTELKPRGASRSAGGRSKNKTLAFRVRCRGRWGFPHHLRWLKMQPPPVVRRRFYLGGCLVYFFDQFAQILGKILKTA